MSHGSPPPAEPVSVGLLHASFEQMDFGVVKQAGRGETTCQLFNKSEKPVEVTQIATSCPCLTVDLPQHVLGPSENMTARLLLDLSKEPRFVGSLGIDIVAKTPEGATAFAFTVPVEVERPPGKER